MYICMYTCMYVCIIDIDHLLSSVCSILLFLPWNCLLPICSTYTKYKAQEVLQQLNKVARVKYQILPYVCDSVLWSFLFSYPYSWTIIQCHIVKRKKTLPDPLPDPLTRTAFLKPSRPCIFQDSQNPPWHPNSPRSPWTERCATHMSNRAFSEEPISVNVHHIWWPFWHHNIFYIHPLDHLSILASILDFSVETKTLHTMSHALSE